jgi:excisionase family DNA binding protein
MIGKPAVIIQIPSQRAFSIAAAAQYLGLHPQTVRELTDLGRIPARRMGKRRVYLLEELDKYLESLPEWTRGEMANGDHRRAG